MLSVDLTSFKLPTLFAFRQGVGSFYILFNLFFLLMKLEEICILYF